MFHIISNPISGRKKSNSKRMKAIFDFLNENKVEYVLYESQYYKHPTEIAKKITSENESGDIIVIGGDGTFNEVLNGISDFSKWNIGLVPAGSGNDFAKNIGLSADLIEDLKIALKKEVKPIDYIKVNDNICVNVLGTGLDVEVLINFEKHTKLKGSFRYFVSLIEALFPLKFHEFDVSIDDGPFERKKGLIIALCNGSDFGGGITICPPANSSDGKLEFVFVDEVKNIQIPKYLINLMSGKILKMPATQHIQCEKVVFKDASNLTLQIDGNITNEYKEYKCEIVRKGINMYR